MESKSASAVNSLTALTSPYMLATILLLSGFFSLFLVNSFGWRQGALFSVGLSAESSCTTPRLVLPLPGVR